LTLAAVFLGACDPQEPRTIGVYAEDSAIHIVSPALCPGERIVGITVYAVQGNVVGDSNDEVLWKAEGSQGTRNTDMIVGQPPPGFVERQRFSGELPSDSSLAAVVDTTLTQRLNEAFEVVIAVVLAARSAPPIRPPPTLVSCQCGRLASRQRYEGRTGPRHQPL
jgi:hypothetical protein